MRFGFIFVQWCILVGLLFSSWWFVALPLVGWLVLSYGLLLPVATAILVDSYFNAFADIPYVSLTVLGCGIFVIMFRPYFYTS